MKQFNSALLTLVLMMPAIAQAHDCVISKAVLLPYALGHNATRLEWRQSGDAIEHLFTACPAGPADRASRAIFFQLVNSAFNAGENIAREADPDRSEAAWESASQFEYDLRQYMDRMVNEKDVEFKSVILKTANALAMSRLGPDAKYDVLRVVHAAEPVRIGAGHHSAYVEAILTLGLWIDPAEKRFTADEKHEITYVLMAKVSDHPETNSTVKPELDSARAVLTALGHANSPDALLVLQNWKNSTEPSLREAAQAGTAAVKARLKHRDHV